MESHHDAHAGPQLVEFRGGIAGKNGNKLPRRLKARHLAQSTRELIVRLFASYESYDDVAREMGIPGLSGKTVSEVIHAWQIRPPAKERRAFEAHSVGFRTMTGGKAA